MYNEDTVFLDEHSDLLDTIQLLNELYIGTTPFVNNLINEVSILRKKLKEYKVPYNYKKSILYKPISNLIKSEFGFNDVRFMILLSKEFRVFTQAINKYDVRPNFVPNMGFKYNNTGNVIIVITMGTLIDQLYDISDKEIAAAILHEIGHSFINQSKNLLYELKNTKSEMQTYTNIIKNCKNNNTIITYDVDIKIIRTILTYILRSYVEIRNVIGVTKISNLLKQLERKKKINERNIAVLRSKEYLSDSFATMYGLGPYISSFLLKKRV